MDMRLVVLDIIHIVDNGEGRGGGTGEKDLFFDTMKFYKFYQYSYYSMYCINYFEPSLIHKREGDRVSIPFPF